MKLIIAVIAACVIGIPAPAHHHGNHHCKKHVLVIGCHMRTPDIPSPFGPPVPNQP